MTATVSQPPPAATVARLARDGIGLIGTANSGKTIFIVSISEQTDRRTGRWRFGFGYPDAIAYVQSLRKSEEHQSTVKIEHKTLMLFPAQTRWSLIGHRIPVLGPRLCTQYQISLPDASGEYIDKVGKCPDDFRQVVDPSLLGPKEGRFAIDFMEYLIQCGGILCCIDPLGWDQDHTETNSASAVASFNACHVAIAHVLKHRPKSLPLPVSVLLTKADQLDDAAKATVRLPAEDCLILEYFKDRNEVPPWLAVEDGWAQFHVMTALRQGNQELDYSERVAWDFVNCHCPLLAEKLHTWNDDERISARPYLVSSAGMPLERRGRQFLLPKPGAMQPVRTSDPIRSVLDRVQAHRTSRLTSRVLTATAIALLALMVLGPWSVNIVSTTAAYLVSKGYLGPARGLLSSYQYHPVIDLDKARAPQRLANLAKANQELAEQLSRSGQPTQHMAQILAAANRASFLSPDGPATAEWRDAILIDLLARATKDLRTDDGVSLIAQSKGLLRPTPSVVEAMRGLLANASAQARHSATDAKAPPSLLALESIAIDLSTDDLFLPQYKATGSPAPWLEESHRLGAIVGASCKATRALAMWSATPSGQRTIATLGAPSAPLDLLLSARRTAMESGDPTAIRDVEQVELQIVRSILGEMCLNDRAWTPDDVHTASALLDRWPAVTTEVAERAEYQAHRARVEARDRLRENASPAQLPSDRRTVIAELSKFRDTDPREAGAIGARFDIQALCASLSTRGSVDSIQDAKRTLQEIDSLSVDSTPLQLSMRNEPAWDLSNEIGMAVQELSRTTEALLNQAIASGDSRQTASIGEIAGCLSQTKLLSAQQQEFHRQGKLTADLIGACLTEGKTPTEVWASIRDLLGGQLERAPSPAAQHAFAQGSSRIRSLDHPPPLTSLLAFRAGMTSQGSLDPAWYPPVSDALRLLDEVIQKRLLSEEVSGVSPEAADLLVKSVLSGDGTPTGRSSTLSRWLGFASMHELPSPLADLTDKLASVVGQTAATPEERSAPFRPLLLEMVSALRDGRARGLSIPRGASQAALAAKAADVVRAFEAIDRHRSLIEQGDFLFVPALGCYVGRTEVTIGWCDAVAGEHAGLKLEFDKDRRKMLTALTKRPEDKLLAFGLSFDDAQSIARACGARLPTPGEWSKLARPPLQNATWQSAVDRDGLEAARDSQSMVDGVALSEPLLGLNAGLREWAADAASRPVLMGGSFVNQAPAATTDEKGQPDTGVRLFVDAVPLEVVKFLQGDR